MMVSGCLLLFLYIFLVDWVEPRQLKHSQPELGGAATLNESQDLNRNVLGLEEKRMLIEFLTIRFALHWLGGNQGAMAIHVFQWGSKDDKKITTLFILSPMSDFLWPYTVLWRVIHHILPCFFLKTT